MIQMVSNNGMAKATKTVQNVTSMSAEECTRLRERAGLSQRELAARVGYSQASISRFETGEQEIPERAAKLITIITSQPKSKIA